MTLFDNDQSILDVELGRVLRIPCRFIQGESDAHPTLVKSLAQQVQKNKKNFLPVIVESIGEDSYKAVHNTQILAAIRQASIDFAWCIVVDKGMLSQVLIEAGQLVQVSILTASEKEIADVLEYIKTQKPGLKAMKPQKAAKAIVHQRENATITSLVFLTKQRCGIGRATIAKIKDCFVLD